MIIRTTKIQYLYIDLLGGIAIKIIVIILLIQLILKQLKYIKQLLLPTRKSIFDIVVLIISICVLSFITYKYANNWVDYLIGILGSVFLITMWLKEGITSKGFISMYKYKEVILWNEIEKFDIHKRKNVKITLIGKFMEQSFKFRIEDYDKVMNIIKDNLHK